MKQKQCNHCRKLIDEKEDYIEIDIWEQDSIQYCNMVCLDRDIVVYHKKNGDDVK